MNLKKNGYSCFIWLLYTVAVSFGLFCVVAFWGNTLGFSLPVLIAATVLILALACGIVYLLYRFTNPFGDFARKNRPLAISLEIVFVLGITVAGILCAVWMPKDNKGAEYFELACVKEGSGVPKLLHGATYLYLQFLHVICRFLGNEFIYCVWAQMILYLITAVVIYAAVRRMFGVLPGLVTISFLMFSTHLTAESRKLSPNILFLLLFFMTLHMIITCMKNESYPIALYIISGIAVGVITYLDVTGIILLLFFATSSKFSYLKRGLLCVSGIVSAVAGFMGCILLDALTSGKGFLNILQAWYRLFAPAKWSLPVSVSAGDAGLEIILLFAGLVIGIFSFFVLQKKEKYGIFFLPMTAVVVAQGFGILSKEMDGSLFIYLFTVILCGVGLGNIYETRIKEEQDEYVPILPEIHDLDKEEIKEDVSEEVAEAVQEEVQAEVTEDTMEVVAESVQEEAPVEELPVEDPVIQYIENPLPLPKKHVPKMLDYDIEVADDDDYDI